MRCLQQNFHLNGFKKNQAFFQKAHFFEKETKKIGRVVKTPFYVSRGTF